ncbi:ATP-binding cassette sub-family C member 4 isoform X1 [Patella vulgata]|uniref:ATP-binding cassette sub-family C member 4 isoform X1 n=2 Tax=Patella vulgata TaxID=6465 RepID=UPI0024A97AFE|nr:ATP-binding cassette sub-family C member 4 isoform X1 [Patella vulgata]
MSEKIPADEKCLYDTANCFSRISFWWLNSLFRKGFRKGLTLDDVSKCPQEDDSSFLWGKIDKLWDYHLTNYRSGKKASLIMAVLSTFKSEFVLPGFLIFICESCRILSPFIIGQLISYFQNTDLVSKTEAYIYAAALGVALVLAMFCDLFHFYKQQHISLKMKTAVGGLIYRKLLSLSSQTFHLTNSGKIVNLLSTDLEKFNFAFETTHYLWLCPIELVVVMSLLYYYIGYPCLFTLVVIAILLPLQILCGRWFGNLRTKIGKWSDKRINKMNEVLSGMKVIKLYCWEKPFHKVITSLRKHEIKFVKRAMSLKSLNLSLMKVSPKLMALVIFVAIWWVGNPLSVRLVFVTVGYMYILQDSVFLFLFLAVENITILLSSLKRVEEFLLLGENKENSTRTFKKVNKQAVTKETRVSIEVERMTARWHINENDYRYSRMEETERILVENEMEKYFSLRNINLTVKKGELLAVIGHVGSGKSSLLMTLMGEIHHNKGQIFVHGSVGYSCQQSWVFAGSLKENVLFGDVYDSKRYQQVLQSCALIKDIGRLSQGDATLVGERGLFLSGGQKARLTLARCVYRDCDIYLLDDPLSSVDSEVGQQIFQQCVTGLLGNKTRILVTHQLQYLQSADRVLILKEGKVSNIGTYNELLQQGVDFTGFEENADKPQIKELETIETLQWKEDTIDLNEEHANTGVIKFWVYRDYIKAGYGYILGPILLITLALNKPSFFLSDWNLAKWAVSYDLPVNQNTSTADWLQINMTSPLVTYNISNNYTTTMIPDVGIPASIPIFTKDMRRYLMYFGVFVVFGFISILLNLQMCVFASQNLHNKMFRKVLGATTRLFDSQPLGRILNRFSRDIGLMDDFLVRLVFINVDLLLTLLGIAINICIIAPWLFIALVPLAIVVVAIRYYAVHTTRDVRRLEALAKSPVYCHISDTIIGLQTIRISDKQKQFTQEFDEFQNQASGAWFMYLSTYRWFSVRSLIGLMIFLNLVIHVCLLMRDSVSPGLLALALTYLLSFGMPFEFFIRITAELENAMTSVERVLSYTHVKQEAERISDRPPPKDWPSQGSITFSDVSLRYTPDSPLILRKIDIHIRSKEKIGIVGRSGAGKTSLLSALFRLAEPEGRIWIDGWDVLQIGLDELRSKISVIPQDPVLFSGTLRYNLDPFDEYSDERLWNALEQVQLREKVVSTPEHLYMEMSESGNNFSVGQRQLVCLARAILRYNAILILDEATAHVDHTTDELIQGTIRAKFIGSTVLTIAHRLHTVMDCDRILVLHDGEVKEFDTPYNLLQEEDGYFTNLVDQTGVQQAAELRNLARIANLKRASASILLEKAVLKADKQLSTSRTSLNKSIRSRNSISRKDSQRKNRQDFDAEHEERNKKEEKTKSSEENSSASNVDIKNNSKEKCVSVISPSKRENSKTHVNSIEI